MTHDAPPCSIWSGARSAFPPVLQDLIPQIDEQGFPATALLGSFLADADGAPQRVFALVDRCLSSWIDHMSLIDCPVVDGMDDSWLRIRAERQQLLERLVHLRSHLRTVEHGGACDD